MLYYYGKSLSRSNDPAALVQFQKSVAANPNFAASYYELGRLESAAGSTPQAINDLTRCLAIDPKMAEAHYALYHIYHRLQQDDLAAAQLAAFQKIRKEFGDQEKVQRLLFTVDR